MKELLRHTRNYIVMVAISAIMGMFLLIAVYAIPNQRGSMIYRNVADSMEVLRQFGDNPELLTGQENTHLDYCTDSLMLNEIVYSGDESLIEKALFVPAYDITTGGWLQALENYISTGENAGGYIQNYARYWHGYLVILKPLMVIFSYQELLILNFFVQMGLVFIVALLLWKKNRGRYILPYLFAVFCLMPLTVAMSMQFSNMFYITMIAAVVYLLFDQKMTKTGIFPEFFMLLGIVTAYIDFLTYPLLALGLVLVLDIICNQESSLFKQMKRLIIFTICWGVGYFGMWISKWVLVAICTQYDIFREAFMMIQYRMEYAVAEETITYKKVIKYNVFYIFANMAYIVPFVGMVLYYIIGITKRIFSQKIEWKCIYGYMYIILLPFVWYAFTANHSCQHYYFTNRTAIIAIFAVFCMLAQLSEKKNIKQDIKQSRKCQ